MSLESLTAKQRRFVDEYLIDLNATQAAIRAGYSKRSARQAGAETMANPVVSAAVVAAQDAQSKRTGITADAVLGRLWSIATADPRELIEYRRTCCRYCHSINHEYQRTQSEMDRDRATWEAKQTKASKDEFNVAGGVGFSAKLPPNAACPECWGDGQPTEFVHDTRDLSEPARALYAGVAITKDGVTVRMQDQQSALLAVGKHLGMFVEKREISVAGGTGVLAVPVPIDAAQWAAGAKAQQEALVARPASAPSSDT